MKVTVTVKDRGEGGKKCRGYKFSPPSSTVNTPVTPPLRVLPPSLACAVCIRRNFLPFSCCCCCCCCISGNRSHCYWKSSCWGVVSSTGLGNGKWAERLDERVLRTGTTEADFCFAVFFFFALDFDAAAATASFRRLIIKSLQQATLPTLKRSPWSLPRGIRTPSDPPPYRNQSSLIHL
jgi:hypothetical protein